MVPPYYTLSEDNVFDLIVVGNGPSALALSARLKERYPHAIYTDVEQSRFLFLRKHANKVPAREHKTLRTIPSSATRDTVKPLLAGPKMLVLDKAGQGWFSSWRAQFKAFGINHLRSPMFFHSHPDPDALISYAHRTGRELQLKEIHGVVGKERSRHQVKRKRGKKLPLTDINERDRQDYFRPSTNLFFDFVDSIVDQYDLHNTIQPGHVTNIISANIHIPSSGPLPDPGLVLTLGDGRIIGAKAVVLAVGINSQPRLPDCIPSTGDHITHTGEIPYKGLIPASLQSKVANPTLCTRALVIGGGLTSVQIVDALIKAGVNHVILLCRSPYIRVKDFDFGLDWAAKYKNVQKAAFWNETDMEERYRMIGEAREGGSVNPEYWRILRNHIKSGKVDLVSGACIKEHVWDEQENKWNVNFQGAPDVDLTPKQLKELECRWEQVDHIYCATGSKPDIECIECMQSILRSHPIEILHGLPCLTEDLQWHEDVPLFLVGGFAALQIGPTAYNLEGGRGCAERVALRLSDYLNLESAGEDPAGYENPRGGSFYSCLSTLDDSRVLK